MIVRELPLIGKAIAFTTNTAGNLAANLGKHIDRLIGDLQVRRSNDHACRAGIEIVAEIIGDKAADISAVVFVAEDGRIGGNGGGAVSPGLTVVIRELPLVNQVHAFSVELEGNNLASLGNHIGDGALDLESDQTHLDGVRGKLVAVLVGDNAADISAVVALVDRHGVDIGVGADIAPSLLLTGVIADLPLIRENLAVFTSCIDGEVSGAIELEDAIRGAGVPEYVGVSLTASSTKAKEVGVREGDEDIFVTTETPTVRFTKPRASKEA